MGLVRPMHRYLIFYTAFTLLTTALLGRAATEHVIYAPPPEYPAEARARHLTGSGVFAVQIRPDGSVERVDTVKSLGHTSLDDAAITAFRKWRFYTHKADWVFRIPIRYVDGPPHRDAAMSARPAPGYGALITVFSRHE